MMKQTKDVVHGTGRIGLFLVLSALTAAPTFAHPGAHKSSPVLATAAPSIPAATETPVGTVSAFHSALKRGNTDAALALMAENALIFESGGVERTRSEYAAHHLKADAAFSASVDRTLVDRSSGKDGDTAWVMSVETIKGSYRNRAINSRSAETMLLRRLDKQWRIVHIHWSSADI